MGESNSPLLSRLTIRQRPGVETFRYWQGGSGCDRNLERAETVLAAIDYLHRNPVRRGLVERAVDWQWSSARW
jgi:putative transposase